MSFESVDWAVPAVDPYDVWLALRGVLAREDLVEFPYTYGAEKMIELRTVFGAAQHKCVTSGANSGTPNLGTPNPGTPNSSTTKTGSASVSISSVSKPGITVYMGSR
jgi:hypothetical protein